MLHERKLPFKKIKPFVAETAVSLFVMILIPVGLLCSGLIEVTVRLHVLTVALGVLLFVLLLFLLFRVIRWGVKALFDYIFQRTRTDTYEFVQQLPYRASLFSEKWVTHTERSVGMYYLIQAKKDAGAVTLISPEFLALTAGNNYVFETAAFSRIIIGCSDAKAEK